MTKEELEKYNNKEVEITVTPLGREEFTFRGKLVKYDIDFATATLASYGIKYNDDWFFLILENKEYLNVNIKAVKKIKEVLL